MGESKERNLDLRLTLLLFAIIGATGFHWLILRLRIPVLDAMPDWKFTINAISINHLWIALAFFAFGLALILSFSKINYAPKIFFLILFGVIIQLSLAYSKGQGLDGIRNRILASGHTEFARVAVEQPDTWYILLNYEDLAAKQKYDYIPSKPPGTLLFYKLTDNISGMLMPASDLETRLNNLGTLASFAWPVISYFVLIPLFYFSREFLKDSDMAVITCLFFMTVPSFNLITLHTDQVLFPVLALTPMLMTVIAFRKGNLLLAALCGAALYLTAYFSFGLAVVGILLPMLILIEIQTGKFRALAYSIKYGCAVVAGIVLSDVFARVFLNYDILVRYNLAMTHHALWRNWENTMSTYLRAGVTTVTEFFIWLGLPLTVLFLTGMGVSIYQQIIRKPTVMSYYDMSLAGIFVFLLLFSKTKVESARLWLFLVPFVCLSVSNFINQQNWRKSSKLIFVIVVLMLELGTTYFTLHYQDFQ